jgi:hypothetical protein
MKNALKPAAIGALALIILGLSFTVGTVWNHVDYSSPPVALELIIGFAITAYVTTGMACLWATGDQHI